jgi:transglutaminase/protease-like cytokinesis protein 3
MPDAPPPGLVTFTLVRGGSSVSDFDSFVNSRRCLRDIMPNWFPYDDIAFHEGNVPRDVQTTLRQQMCVQISRTVCVS